MPVPKLATRRARSVDMNKASKRLAIRADRRNESVDESNSAWLRQMAHESGVVVRGAVPQ